MSDPLVADLVAALTATVSGAELRQRLARHFAAPRPAGSAPTPGGDGSLSEAARKLLGRIGLADILDESILEARPGDQTFPLRLFFGELVTGSSGDDCAFALASGLNLYFRAPMTEEAKVRIGIEVSRLYYRFASGALEPALMARLSPLLAKLMSTELGQLKLECVDHVRTFDSAIHERAEDADASNATVIRPLSFLCRVASTERPRIKALVST